jgi:hypothetical protein
VRSSRGNLLILSILNLSFSSSGAGVAWRYPACREYIPQSSSQFRNRQARSLTRKDQLPAPASLSALSFFMRYCDEWQGTRSELDL